MTDPANIMHTIRLKIRCLSLAGCCLFLGGREECGTADKQAPLRWAIISNLSSKHAPAVDLLSAKLSGLPEFALVERDEVKAAYQEAEVRALAAVVPAATAKRNQLGGQLSADVLMIVDEVAVPKIDEPQELAPPATSRPPKTSGQTGQVIRVTICDVRSGARLFIDGVPKSGLNVEQISDRLVEIGQRARLRLAGGLRYVVAVSPFVSQDLVRDFDSFQATLPHLLEVAFAEMPGVAVIEREEGQAIWQELADRPNSSPVRIVPLIVEGEFKSISNSDPQKPTVRVTVTCRRPGAEPRIFKSDSISAAELPPWLASLPRQAIDNASAEKSLAAFNAQEQFTRLSSRAEGFGAVGEWYHAMGLRQAALMLRPMDSENRLKLIGDQRALLSTIAISALPAADWLPKEEDSRLRKLLAIYRDQLANVDFLIRNSQVGKRRASGLIQGWHAFRNLHKKAACNELMREAEQERKEMLSSIALKLFELPDDPKENDRMVRPDARAGLQNALLSEAAQRIDQDFPTASDLDFLYQLWTTRIPDRLGLPRAVASIRGDLFSASDQFVKSKRGPKPSSSERNSVSRDEWSAFIDRLARSDHETARVVGLAERVIWRWYLVDQKTPRDKLAELPALVAEATRALEKYPHASSRGRRTLYDSGDYFDRLEELRWQVERLKDAPDPFAPRRRLTVSEKKERPHSSSTGHDPWRATRSGRVSLNKLPFQLPVESIIVGEHNRDAQWINWGNRFDVVWTPREIWWMTQRGQFKKLELEGATKGTFDDVQSHGQVLWVAARSGGIWVIDQQGQLIRRVTGTDNLPPADQGIKVYPLAERKACVVGSFGKDRRAWCAMLDITGDATKVQVFHEAKLVKKPAGLNSALNQRTGEDALHEVFVPHSLIPHVAEDGRKLLYVCRGEGGQYAWHRALVIDLETLKVSAAPLELSLRTNLAEDQPDAYISHDGKLRHGAALSLHFQLIGTRRSVEFNRNQPLIRTKDAIYLPRKTGWDELNFDDETVEDLCQPDRPLYRLGSMRFASSAHYGIVGWDYDATRRSSPDVYQVVIDPPAAENKTATAPQAKPSPPPQTPPPQTPPSKQTPKAADRESNFPLSDSERKSMFETIDRMLANEPRAPENTRVLYMDGIAHFDGWLPAIHPESAYLDPPEVRQGLKWTFADGRLMRIEALNPTRLSDSFLIWRGPAGEPLLVRHTQQQSPHNRQRARQPHAKAETATPSVAEKRALEEEQRGEQSSYSYGFYDARGLLSRVVKLDPRLKVYSMTVYEHSDRYQTATIHECDAEGRVRMTRKEPGLDANGKPVESDDPAKIIYSPRFERVTTPMRAGLEPYYPIPN
jgi:hypothetical protein